MECMNVYCEILIEFLNIYYVQFVMQIVNKVYIGIFFLELVSSLLLTPCNKVLLKELVFAQMVKKFPPSSGTLWFITAFR
jgi:uncharacterized membrane protein YdfJ with MMPL/SSD domain